MDDQIKLPSDELPSEGMVDAGTQTEEADDRSASLRSIIYEILETVLLAAIIWLAVNFATARFVVEGSSMEPSFYTGQVLVINRLAARFGTLQRGDVVVFLYPGNLVDDYIKRIIGLPGETITLENGHVYVNGVLLNEPYAAQGANTSYGKWVVPADSYFVLGDNRPHSSDSRSWGMLKKEYIIGTAWICYWPPEHWGIVPHYSYEEAP